MWQIMTYYFDEWTKRCTAEPRIHAAPIADDITVTTASTATSVKQKGGARKGFKETACRTADKYLEMKDKVRKIRNDHLHTASRWSNALRVYARKREGEMIRRNNAKQEKVRADAIATENARLAAEALMPRTGPRLEEEMAEMLVDESAMGPGFADEIETLFAEMPHLYDEEEENDVLYGTGTDTTDGDSSTTELN